MPTVIDSLLVTLGLDARQYRKEAADVRGDQGRVVEQSDKMAKRLDSDGKRMAGTFRNVRNEVAGLLLAFTGAATITSFARSILDSDAATGRLATNLGMATEQVSAWEGAIKRVGGDAKDADAALQSMAAAFETYKLTGTTGKDADFQGLGVSLNDLQNPANALLKIAEASERMSRPEFVARAGRLGLSDATITLLAKGRAGVEGLVDEQAELGVATDASARAAQHLQDRLAVMDALLREKLRPVLEWVVEKTIEWAGSTENLKTAATGLVVILGGLTLWAIAAAAPFVAVAGAIALVLTNLDRLKEVASRLMAGDFQGAWAALTTGNSSGFGTPDVSGVSDNWIGKVTGGRRGAGGRRSMGWTPRISENPDASVDKKISLIARQAGVDPDQPLTLAQFLALDMTKLEGRPAGRHNYGNMRNMDGSWKQFNSPAEYQAAQRAWLQRRWSRQGARTIRDAVEGTPVGGGGPDLGRGMAVMGGRAPLNVPRGNTSSTTMSVGEITIYTAATDAPGIARDLPGALQRRGLVVQSGSGMLP